MVAARHSVVAWFGRAVEWGKGTRAGRSVVRYLDSNGELMASGMSFSAIFSVSSAVYLFFALCGLYLGNNEMLRDQLVTQLSDLVPGLIDTGNGGLAKPDQLFSTPALGWTSIIAAIVVALTAVGWLSYSRRAIRTMFGLHPAPRPFVLQKLVDLGLALLFGAVFVASAVVSIITTTAIQRILAGFGFDPERFDGSILLQLSAAVGIVLLDVIVLLGMFRIIAKVKLPLRALIPGSVVGALLLGILRTFGAQLLVGGATQIFLASFAVLIGLMLWFNIVSRIILFTAAWVAEGHAAEVLVAHGDDAPEAVVGGVQ